MNRENILRVADAIEHSAVDGLGFNMCDWIDDIGIDRSGHNCGTTACIAGWAWHLKNNLTTAVNELEYIELLDDFDNDVSTAEDTAIDFLGISETPANQLFHGGTDYTTSAEAVRVLRHLADTGEVDWALAKSAA